jgi:hypothetical protein
MYTACFARELVSLTENAPELTNEILFPREEYDDFAKVVCAC